MDAITKPTAVLIEKPEAGKARGVAEAVKAQTARAGVSIIGDTHWKAIAGACGGEAKLIAALGCTDKRTGKGR